MTLCDNQLYQIVEKDLKAKGEYLPEVNYVLSKELIMASRPY